LQKGEGLTLGALGRHFSGRVAESVGTLSLKLLSYALLAVFIYGGSSVLQELTGASFNAIASLYAVAVIVLLLLPIKLIDYINRLLFVGLIAVIAVLIVGLTLAIDWSHLPLFSDRYSDMTVWAALIPVVFTSFGFQVIFHTLTNYCQKNAKMLKQAFLWGSLIPAIVYILWTSSVLSAVYHHNPTVYAQMAEGHIEVGELIQALSGISPWQSVQLLVWWISNLAIATSVIGVGVGLCDSLKEMTGKKMPAALLTVLPAYLVVIYVPNAFIAVLGFAGMVLAVLAILLPLYLFRKIKGELFYRELKMKGLILLSLAVGCVVILCELFNML
jgi:tyrosine-specific transport protein